MGRYAHDEKRCEPKLIEGALRAVGAWHLAERDICELSGGERQRIYIARAIVTQAPIILLDEQTANLDIGNQMEIWKLMQTQANHGRCVIVVTHDIRFAKRHATHALLMENGQSITCGPIEQELNPDRIAKLFNVDAYELLDNQSVSLSL